MKQLLILGAVGLLLSCSNQNLNDSDTVSGEITQIDSTDVFDTLRENLIVRPNLDELDFIVFDSTYSFTVENVPLENIGASINRGRITITAPGKFEFFVHPPKDSIDIKIFAQIDGVREDLYAVRKKMKE